MLNVAYAEVAFGLANVTLGVCLYLRRRHMFPMHARHVPLVVLSVVRAMQNAISCSSTKREPDKIREPK